MRADRLMALLLLLLQQREHVTAAAVARELEISERTARRDLDALAMAGVPVYSMPGRGGGWRLVGGARTDLSGLTAGEARALFLVAGPAAAATPAVKGALRKLVQALPEPFRVQAEAAASSLVTDPQRWGSSRIDHRPLAGHRRQGPVLVHDPRHEAGRRTVRIDRGRTPLEMCRGDRLPGRTRPSVDHRQRPHRTVRPGNQHRSEPSDVGMPVRSRIRSK